MTPTTIALMACAFCPATLVLWYCICSANQMASDTPHGQRLSVVLIAAGVFADMLAILSGGVPDTADILLLTGLMVLVRSNCRRGVCPCVWLPTWPERRKEPR